MKHTSFTLAVISLAILGGCNKAPEVKQNTPTEQSVSQIAVMPPVAKKVPYDQA